MCGGSNDDAKKITKYEISGMTETTQNDSSEIASLNMNGMKTDS